MIEFLKNQVWFAPIAMVIIVGIGGIFANYNFLKTWAKQNRERNRNLYIEKLKSKYSELFEYYGGEEIPEYINIINKPFNLTEIIGFCSRVNDFYNDGRKFKGLFTSFRFYRLYLVAKKLNAYSANPSFSFDTNFQTSQTTGKYVNFYKTNERQMKQLEKRFKKLRKTFDD